MISVITRGEILYGLARLPNGKRRSDLEAKAVKLFAQFPCIGVLEPESASYAALREESARRGTSLADNDLWIAATALGLGAVLVTADHDFQRAPGLQLADWTQ